MPTNILRPLAEGDYAGYTLGAGATKMAAVDSGDPVSHDDNTSYIGSSGAVNQSFTLQNKPGISVVNSVSIGIRQISIAASAAGTLHARFGGVDGASAVSWGADAVYTTDGPLACPRPGGGSWTPGDIGDATLQMVVKCTVGGSTGRVTTMWMEVDYEPAAGGFAFLLALGPIASLLGAGLTFAEFCRALTFLPDIRYTAAEKRELWREMRAYRHPRFFLPEMAR